MAVGVLSAPQPMDLWEQQTSLYEELLQDGDSSAEASASSDPTSTVVTAPDGPGWPGDDFPYEPVADRYHAADDPMADPTRTMAFPPTSMSHPCLVHVGHDMGFSRTYNGSSVSGVGRMFQTGKEGAAVKAKFATKTQGTFDVKVMSGPDDTCFAIWTPTVTPQKGSKPAAGGADDSVKPTCITFYPDLASGTSAGCGSETMECLPKCTDKDHMYVWRNTDGNNGNDGKEYETELFTQSATEVDPIALRELDGWDA
jgi:hypothetical protein